MRTAARDGIFAVGALLLLANPLAEACGDKLLSIARGIRLQQVYKAQHPASILFYVGDTSNVTAERREALVQMSILYMSLRQAGHTLQVAQSADELGEALGTAEFDFVLADVRDVATVAEQSAAHPSAPSTLPVLFKPSQADYAVASDQFELVLATPASSVDHLEAIDRAMEARARGTSTGA